MKSISIIGCGWLGLPTAKYFLAQGITVKGSTSSDEKLASLTELGIKAYHFNSEVPDSYKGLPELCSSDIIILNIPFKRSLKNPYTFVELHRQILEHCHNSQHILFISSTSVYPKEPGLWSENGEFTPKTDRQKALLQTEALIQSFHRKSTILRFSGLAGPGRTIRSAEANSIHLDECIQMIETCIHKPLTGVINGCTVQGNSRKIDNRKWLELS